MAVSNPQTEWTLTAPYGDDAATLARRHRGIDENGYRAEFVRLIELADALTRQSVPDGR